MFVATGLVDTFGGVTFVLFRGGLAGQVRSWALERSGRSPR